MREEALGRFSDHYLRNLVLWDNACDGGDLDVKPCRALRMSPKLNSFLQNPVLRSTYQSFQLQSGRSAEFAAVENICSGLDVGRHPSRQRQVPSMPRIGKCRKEGLPSACCGLANCIDALAASTIVWTTTGLVIDMAEIPIQEVSRRRFTHSRCLAQRFASFLPVAGGAFSRSGL